VAEPSLHSLAEFSEMILSCLEIAGAADVVMVGPERGSLTRKLLGHAIHWGGRLAVVDPSPSPETEKFLRLNRCVSLHKEPSLSVLPALKADAVLLDGDRNYYTVLHESELIWEQTQASPRRLLIFYHDVCWPWARRDRYSDPARIPQEFRHPHTWDLGVVPDHPGVVTGGLRGMGRWACALEEGGPRNGVLTAIEDFVAGKEDRLSWACIPAVFGLGVLFEKTAPWATLLARFLLPYHMNPLLERLEMNRLASSLGSAARQGEEPHEHAA
jgi:hypothetical protein